MSEKGKRKYSKRLAYARNLATSAYGDAVVLCVATMSGRKGVIPDDQARKKLARFKEYMNALIKEMEAMKL